MKIIEHKVSESEFLFIQNSLHRHWLRECCNDVDCSFRIHLDTIALNRYNRAVERLS